MASLTERINNFTPWYKKHPYVLVALIVAAVALVVFIAWPRPKEVGIPADEQARIDSAALHVVLMPVADCQPIYYAEENGIYDELGLDLRITTMQAQMDIDTAFIRGHAEFAYSDLIRAIFMQQTNTVDLRVVAGAEGKLQLVTTAKQELSLMGQLKEKMVAVARHSITDYWSDRIMTEACMELDEIFRPQINDIRLRTDMILNGTMDAALLPEPFSTEAIEAGHRAIFSTKDRLPQLAAFIIPTWVTTDESRMQQLSLLFKGYNMAVERLNADENKQLTYMPLRAVHQADVDSAWVWLQRREQARNGYSTSKLVFKDERLEVTD